MTVWVKDGWLSAKRTSAAGSLDWQVFICPIEKSKAPKIRIREGLDYVEVSYDDDRYFVRDSDDIIRCRRKLKLAGELFAKDEFVSLAAKTAGGATSTTNKLQFSCWRDGDSYSVAAGPDDEQWNAYVRLDPDADGKVGYGVRISSTGLTNFFHGDRWLVDDGELIVASRTLEEDYLREQKENETRRKILGGGQLPELSVTKWLNQDEPLDWEKLKGKVVLVDFWGVWCGPCVAKLPALEPLHQKFSEKGLVIIAMHSSQGADECDDFVNEHNFTFPVAIDSGATAKEFAINGWPSYFLIDRGGKTVVAYSHETPMESEIAQLLGKEAETALKSE